ncbi:hypothetical protein [Burkholderia thailandensis]|uniref:hypothetical protein n=1 Tax=Burkholderia thailandensis TaxID=57975 RepID=UPI000FD6A394|nr:hypothetical protein [Burkholderia thailandensis]MBS2128278.1 hypothetical protein [Burkholderia thailandensis]MCS3400326.1 hypothetical protein [Burkholderia thailandensis]MCS6479512.1 hypothetical protein [Burkholderia thailandensis]MCS6519768.1 hypothetical protein [Burkholderia thailandensis]NBC94586.1 hypothetical protein [Burkholderia thailandensis]
MRSFDVQRLVCFSLAEFGKGTESFVPEEATLSYWAGRIDVAAARRRDTHRSGRDPQCDASGNAVAPMSKLSGSKVQRFRRNSPHSTSAQHGVAGMRNAQLTRKGMRHRTHSARSGSKRHDVMRPVIWRQEE